MMSAIWTSSERPMSVRTIWVDGSRHVILSQNDPFLHSKSFLRHRLRFRSTSASKDNNLFIKHKLCKSVAQSDTYFDNCILKLHLAIDNNKCESITYKYNRRQSIPVSFKSISAASWESHIVKDILERTIEHGRMGDIYSTDLARTATLYNKRILLVSKQKANISLINGDALLNNVENNISFLGLNQGEWHTRSLQSNALSDKVLQWLNLSSRDRSHELQQRQFQTFFSKNEELITKGVNHKLPNSKTDQFKGTRVKTVVKLTSISNNDLTTSDTNIENITNKNTSVKQSRENSMINLCKITKRSNAKISILLQDSDKETKKKTYLKTNAISGDINKASLFSRISIIKPQLHVFMPRLKSYEM